MHYPAWVRKFGGQKFDLYPTPGDKGDVNKAKQELQQCGQPNGFSTTMAFRADRPKEKAVAQATQQSLSRIGIKIMSERLHQLDGSVRFSRGRTGGTVLVAEAPVRPIDLVGLTAEIGRS